MTFVGKVPKIARRREEGEPGRQSVGPDHQPREKLAAQTVKVFAVVFGVTAAAEVLFCKSTLVSPLIVTVRR